MDEKYITTKGYEFSRRRAICSEHGFQRKVRTDFSSNQKDFAGMNMHYGMFCLECGQLCKEEKAEALPCHLAFVPVEDVVELCTFDGTFDEGEGMSMGHPINWKYPKNAISIWTLGSLRDYESHLNDWLKFIFKENPQANQIYVEGLQGFTGYFSRQDVN
jgi:hypothetical protein